MATRPRQRFNNARAVAHRINLQVGQTVNAARRNLHSCQRSALSPTRSSSPTAQPACAPWRLSRITESSCDRVDTAATTWSEGPCHLGCAYRLWCSCRRDHGRTAASGPKTRQCDANPTRTVASYNCSASRSVQPISGASRTSNPEDDTEITPQSAQDTNRAAVLGHPVKLISRLTW